jgi:methylenetetrahydrofolate reductase (NADPH)
VHNDSPPWHNAAATEKRVSERLVAALEHPRFELVPIQGAEEQVTYLPFGATVTITCSPTRGLEPTLLLAEQLSDDPGLSGLSLHVVPHIAARLVTDKSHLQTIVQRLAQLHVQEIFVVGGDARKPVGAFSSGLELLQALAGIEHEFHEIGVPAYPERHPLIDDATLLRTLYEKQSFATYMVTQICFDPATVLRWLANLRRQGIVLPAYIGVPGVMDMKRLLRTAIRIGVGDSMRFLAKHTHLTMYLLGSESYHPDKLVGAIAPYLGDAEYNIRGFHINTFNQVQSTERWRQRALAVFAYQALRSSGRF